MLTDDDTRANFAGNYAETFDADGGVSTRTPQQVVARLERFAARRGPDGVARAMRMLKITGYRGNSQVCPLACYLGRHFPDYRINVSGYICITDGLTTLVDRVAHNKLREFVVAFDCKSYPELIREDNRVA